MTLSTGFLDPRKINNYQLIDLIAQYDYYLVPVTAGLLYLRKWEEYVQHGKVLSEHGKIYKYQKFPAELINKTFTLLGNLFFSELKCQHFSHTLNDKSILTFEHAKSHFPEILRDFKGLDLKELLCEMITNAYHIGMAQKALMAIEYKRKNENRVELSRIWRRNDEQKSVEEQNKAV